MKKLIPALGIFLVSQIALFFLAVSRLGPGAKYLSGYPAHFIAAFGTALLLVYILKHEKVKAQLPYIIAIIYVLIMSLGVELVQYFIPYRSFDLIDMLWGIFGMITAILAAKGLEQVQN